MTATVTHIGLFDCQVCVPSDWTDEQVIEFAEQSNPSGTRNGWSVRKEGSEYLEGAPERVSCSDRDGHVHIVLDA